MSATRPLALLFVIAMLAALPAAASASAQVNVYNLGLQVEGAPGVAGFPAPTGLDVQLTTGEQSNLRPATVNTLSLTLGGTKLGGSGLPGCPFSALSDAAGPGIAACPSGSIVGTGGEFIETIGPPSDTANKSLYCYLTATLVNSTDPGHLLVWLSGGPTASANPIHTCVVEVHQAFDATVTGDGSGSTVSMSFPVNLVHPASLDGAITLIHLHFDKPATTAGYTTSMACPTASATATTDTDMQTVGAPPFACLPAVGQCPAGQVGTPPDCTTPAPATCPAGQVGTPPDCTTPAPATCPAGQVGTPPDCTTPAPATCPAGQVGTPPTCTTPAVAQPRLTLPASVAQSKLSKGIKLGLTGLKPASTITAKIALKGKTIATVKGKADNSGRASLTVKVAKGSIKKIKRKSTLSAQVQTVRVDGSTAVLRGTTRVT